MSLARATEQARARQKPGKVLVAFAGDNSFNWWAERAGRASRATYATASRAPLAACSLATRKRRAHSAARLPRCRLAPADLQPFELNYERLRNQPVPKARPLLDLCCAVLCHTSSRLCLPRLRPLRSAWPGKPQPLHLAPPSFPCHFCAAEPGCGLQARGGGNEGARGPAQGAAARHKPLSARLSGAAGAGRPRAGAGGGAAAHARRCGAGGLPGARCAGLAARGGAQRAGRRGRGRGGGGSGGRRGRGGCSTLL